MITSFTVAKPQQTQTIGAGGIAAITAAGAVVSQGANAYSTGRMNRKNRKWAEHMHGVQRHEALEDWHRTNEYNSPVEQMKRLKAAGLNPNLVYGTGTDVTAPSPRASSYDQPQTEAPQFSNIAGETLSKYQQAALQEQQIKNMQATENLIKAQTEAALANAGLKNISLETEQELQEIGGVQVKQRLSDYQKSSAEAETANAKMRSALVQAEVDEMTKQTSVDAAIQKLIQMREQTAKTSQEVENLKETYRILKANGTIAELDAEFAGNMNRRWDGYLIKLLGIIFGGKK